MAKSKNKKVVDNNTLSVEELNSKTSDAQLRLKRMQFSHAITPLENPMLIKSTRREIAKYKTAIRRKQLGF